MLSGLALRRRTSSTIPTMACPIWVSVTRRSERSVACRTQKTAARARFNSERVLLFDDDVQKEYEYGDIYVVRVGILKGGCSLKIRGWLFSIFWMHLLVWP